jgi:glycosyltransferase involved in cell wall biosynthesis
MMRKEKSLSRRRILYLGNDAGYFIAHRLPQARAAMQAGYDVHVATPLSDDVNVIKGEGFEFHPIPMNRWRGKYLDEISSIAAILKLYRSLRPDLAYHATIKPILYGGIAARLTRVSAVVNAITGLGYIFISNELRVRMIRAAVKQIYRFVFGHPNSCVIFQNPDDLRTFLREHLVDEAKTELIMGSCVDLKDFIFRPEPQGVPTVVLASRLLWDKGVGEFVGAAKLLKESGVAARFVLIGAPESDNPSTVSQETVESWHKSGLVEWLGYSKDMPRVLAQANVVCLPSYREGLPNVLIEAAACGRAIVTTDTPGCREIVREGVNGLLVPVKDTVALANALRILLEDADLRAKMGERSHAIAISEFSLERVIERTLAVFRRLLA